MSNIVKGMNLLADIIDEKAIDKLEQAALLHKRHSRIIFKIIKVNGSKVTVKTVQEKSPAGNYVDQKKLIQITKELFEKFMPDYVFHVHATPFIESPVEKVDFNWISEKMLQTGIRLKDISADTGIDYTQLSALINGKRDLSQPMKALFYYYFLVKSPLK